MCKNQGNPPRYLFKLEIGNVWLHLALSHFCNPQRLPLNAIKVWQQNMEIWEIHFVAIFLSKTQGKWGFRLYRN